MYLVNIYFHDNKTITSELLEEHTKWVKKATANKLFLIAGQKTTSKGGVILMRDMSKEELTQLLDQDPFIVNDLVSYSIIHFEPAFYQAEMQNFINE